jgi:hypothetical protein
MENIDLTYGIDTMSVARSDYPTVESILNSSIVKSTLRLPESVTARDDGDNVLTGAIPSTVSSIRFDRTQGGKN